MTITFSTALGARLAAAATFLGMPVEELTEWLLSDQLRRIEAVQGTPVASEISDVLRAKIEATPLLVVDNAGRITMDNLKKDTEPGEI